jgi:hypothetical protein
MNSFPNKGLALAASLLLIASTGEAFSLLRAKLTSPNAATPSPPPPRRTTTVATFGSLRDILESPGGVDGDGKSDGGGGVDPRAGGFGNLINFSRSKFSDTKFQSRGSVTGSSRGGLHVDRLSAFSFATASQKSQSEGSPSSSSGGGINEIDDVDGDDAPDGGDAADDDARGAAAGRRGKRYDDVAADNFNNMVGTF